VENKSIFFTYKRLIFFLFPYGSCSLDGLYFNLFSNALPTKKRTVSKLSNGTKRSPGVIVSRTREIFDERKGKITFYTLLEAGITVLKKNLGWVQYLPEKDALCSPSFERELYENDIGMLLRYVGVFSYEYYFDLVPHQVKADTERNEFLKMIKEAKIEWLTGMFRSKDPDFDSTLLSRSVINPYTEKNLNELCEEYGLDFWEIRAELYEDEYRVIDDDYLMTDGAQGFFMNRSQMMNLKPIRKDPNDFQETQYYNHIGLLYTKPRIFAVYHTGATGTYFSKAFRDSCYTHIKDVAGVLRIDNGTFTQRVPAVLFFNNERQFKRQFEKIYTYRTVGKKSKLNLSELYSALYMVGLDAEYTRLVYATISKPQIYTSVINQYNHEKNYQPVNSWSSIPASIQSFFRKNPDDPEELIVHGFALDFRVLYYVYEELRGVPVTKTEIRSQHIDKNDLECITAKALKKKGKKNSVSFYIKK